jgi:hypothetical protein
MSAILNDLSKLVQWLHLIVGGFFSIMGIIGSVGTLLVFSHRRLRNSICSRYIMVGSVFDLIQIIILILLNFFPIGLQIDLLSKNRILCKLSYFLGVSATLGPTFCLYMSLFDRWVSSSQNVHRRQLSNKRLANTALIIIIIFCILFASPNLYVFDIVTINNVGQQVCIPISYQYLEYVSYFVNPVLTFGLPLIIISTFTILISININKLIGRQIAVRLERQLTLMTICQALCLIGSITPVCVDFFYSSITQSVEKDPIRLQIENLYSQIAWLLYYLAYVCSFYIYLITSSEVRLSLKEIIRHRIQPRNHVGTVTHFNGTSARVVNIQ